MVFQAGFLSMKNAVNSSNMVIRLKILLRTIQTFLFPSRFSLIVLSHLHLEITSSTRDYLEINA